MLERVSSPSGSPWISGAAIYALAEELFPICRSITGDGVRQTLRILADYFPLEIHEVPTGTNVFDWTVPREWNIRDAYIKDAQGRRIVDFAKSNLHVVSYSAPIKARLPLDELKRHIHTLPDRPKLIPYRTSYYAETWGFCMSHEEFLALQEGEYDVCIDSTLSDGSLTYGEFVHRGESEDEVLISAHVCHPSLADDNCSGLSVLAHLAAEIASRRTRLTYRFIVAPGTIGAITWLARNEQNAPRIKAGILLSCVGDRAPPVFKRSRNGKAHIDRIMQNVLAHSSPKGTLIDFSPYGYDERQYCSPAFDLPVGLLQRSRFGTFPEYHTSADNLDFITPENLEASCRIVLEAIAVLEGDGKMLNLSPKCEPQLGRRGLYSNTGGDPNAAARAMAMLWVLNFSDGHHSLLDIAERAEMPFSTVHEASEKLRQAGLLAELSENDHQAGL
jgi:aminopeptidase-like protein